MLVLAGVALWALSRQDAGGTAAPDAADRPTPFTEIPGRPADAFPMTVGYVFDGDTIELQHDAPNEAVTTTAPIRVRLIGVDTPEGTPAPECWADEARAHLAALAPEGACGSVSMRPGSMRQGSMRPGTATTGASSTCGPTTAGS